METYFIRGAQGQCPKCSGHRFSGPSQLQLGDTVTCVNCSNPCTVEAALIAGASEVGIEQVPSDEPPKPANQ